MSQEVEQSRENGNGLSAPVIIFCEKCRSILGDTTALVNITQDPPTITLKAASNISRSEEIHTLYSTHGRGSTYHTIHCAHCGHEVGRQFVTTTSDFDNIRDYITLNGSSIGSYSLGSATYVVSVNGNKVTRDSVATTPTPVLVGRDAVETIELRRQIAQLQKMMLVFNERMDAIEK